MGKYFGVGKLLGEILGLILLGKIREGMILLGKVFEE